MNTPKIIAAGHICLDITPLFPAAAKISKLDEVLAPGKLIHMDGVSVSVGGSVANTGLALKKLGNNVTLMGKIGSDDFGMLVQQILDQYGTHGLIVDSNSATSYSVVLAVPGIDRIFLHNPGANDTFCNSDIPDKVLEDTVLFHFGYPPLMKRVYENGGCELTAIFRRMKANGIATSLDFASIDPNSPEGYVDWQLVLSNVLPYVDFFLPSFEELCFMLDRARFDRLNSLGGDMTGHLNIERDVVPLAEKCMMLGCGSVLIKCGTAGLYWRTGAMKNVGRCLKIGTDVWADRDGFQPCYRAEIVRSATGAGDTCIAAFLTAVLRGRTPAESVALAAAEGACAVTSYDALGGLKSIEELEIKIAADHFSKEC